MMSGVAYGLPFVEYQAEPHINQSGLKDILQSPLHYQIRRKQPREETKALMLGSAAHCAILENSEFSNRYVIAPAEMDRRTKEGKRICEELEQSGKVILSANDGQAVLAMGESVHTHDTARKLLRNGRAEVSIFSEMNGIPAKCRADYLRPGVIVDLKTTDDASPAGFARSIAKYGYDLQAAFYIDCCAAAGLTIDAFIFLAVEKSPPYAVGLYELDSASIEVGRTKYQKALSLYRYCLDVDEWPGYSDEIITLSLPAWAMREAA